MPPLAEKERKKLRPTKPVFSKGNGGFEFIIKTAAWLCCLFSAAKYQLP